MSEQLINDIYAAKEAIRRVLHQWRGRGLTQAADNYLSDAMIAMDEAVGVSEQEAGRA